jgi:indolepyruvate ferredoxin oxidoreductase beta subunit
LSVLTGSAQYPDGVIDKLRAEVHDMIAFNAWKIASDLGSVKAQNIVLLGALARGMKLDLIDWNAVLKDLLPPKLYELNARAFAAGAAELK